MMGRDRERTKSLQPMMVVGKTTLQTLELHIREVARYAARLPETLIAIAPLTHRMAVVKLALTEI